MELNISDLQPGIYNGALQSAHNFLTAYLDQEEKIIDALKKFTGIKTEIYLKEIDKSLDDIVKFSSLFSDLTILNHTTSGTTESHLSYSERDSEYFREPQITMDQALLKNLHYSFYHFTPIYVYRSDAEVKKLVTKYSSLFNSNKLLMRPLRAVVIKNKLQNRENSLHYVNPNTSNDHWYVDKLDKDALLLDNGLKPKEIIKLFDLTLPYFTNISIDTLSEILQDESDLLSGFRAALKQTVTNCATELKSAIEIRQDILQPQIDRVNRKFKSIKSVHQLSVGGSVGAFTLTLLLGVYTGTEIKQLLETSLVAAALIASEIKYQSSVDKLKDNDYFLLWRISKA